MTHSVRAYVLALVAFVTLPGTAQAQSPLEAGSGWVVSAIGGLAIDEDGDLTPAAGAAAAYAVTERIAAEGELAHAFDIEPGDSAVDASVTTVHGSMLYFFTTPFSMTPYVAAGIGIAKFSQDVAGAGDTGRTEIGFNAGAGVTYPFNDRVWARGDFRFMRHIDNVPMLWRFTGALTVRLGE